MTTSQQQQQQQIVLTMIGSSNSDRVSYFTASMGLMILMRTMHYRAKGAMTATATTTAATAACYKQLLNSIAAVGAHWSHF